MAINIDDGGFSRNVSHDVCVPDFLKHSLWHSASLGHFFLSFQDRVRLFIDPVTSLYHTSELSVASTTFRFLQRANCQLNCQNSLTQSSLEAHSLTSLCMKTVTVEQPTRPVVVPKLLCTPALFTLSIQYFS